jgi:hypothetical protein
LLIGGVVRWRIAGEVDLLDRFKVKLGPETPPFGRAGKLKEARWLAM